MSPIGIRDLTTAGEVHPSPFVGPINHTVAITVDVSTLSDDEVDANGYLKPGVILQQNGDLVNGTSQIAYGAVVEAVKVAADNSALGSVTDDVQVAVALFCVINRDILEDSLGRALTSNELAAVNAAGSHVAITPT